MALTPKQQRFVQLYVTSLNATKAAEGAGYSARTARQQGQRLLTHVDIAGAIAASQEKLAARTDISHDRLLAEWALIAFSDINHYLVDPGGGVALRNGAPEDASRAISSTESTTETDPDGRVTDRVKLRLWDKPRALENIGKHLGFYPKDEGAPNGRQALSVDKSGTKTRITWGDLVLEV